MLALTAVTCLSLVACGSSTSTSIATGAVFGAKLVTPADWFLTSTDNGSGAQAVTADQEVTMVFTDAVNNGNGSGTADLGLTFFDSAARNGTVTVSNVVKGTGDFDLKVGAISVTGKASLSKDGKTLTMDVLTASAAAAQFAVGTTYTFVAQGTAAAR